jgi:hypothetical protein
MTHFIVIIILKYAAILAGKSGWRNVSHIPLQKYIQHCIPIQGI